MRVKLPLVLCSDDGQEDTVTDVVTLQKDSQRIEHLGLPLREAKQLLNTIQKRLLQQQMKALLDGCSTCPNCGPPFKPTVSLDVIALVTSSCRYDRGQIEHRAAHAFAAHVATQRGRAKRRQHRPQPRAGTPQWLHTGGATTPSLHMPREARPAHLSNFRLLVMASPQPLLVGSD
jgi:uncharacterized protein with von Willebrand factor type A (vWA) domain